MNKAILILSLFVVIVVCVPLLVYKASTMPEPMGEAYGEIDTLSEPVQVSYTGQMFPHTVENFQFEIEPVAAYTISCVVISKRYHTNTLEDKLSPVDLCVVWGALSEPENLEHIYSLQAGRWCSFRYTSELTVDQSYIENHIANMHLIPANENVNKAVKSIKEGQKIYMEGYLVKVFKYGQCIWVSSLSREDSGEGACEVFYVTKVRIGTAVYE
jgi:hypothetical protein